MFFYFDGASFEHKLHQMDETRTHKSRSKKCEGLRITAKRKKEVVNGRSVHLFVAIDHGKDVAMYE